MRLQSLAHLLQSVSALAQPRRIVVLGSSSLLPQHPHLGDSGQPLELSLDADLLVEPIDESLATVLKDAVGHESAFEQRHGYYADILRPTIVEVLPAGWESRLHPVAGYDNVFALVELLVGRQKDLDLLRALLRLAILEPARLRAHYQATPLDEHAATAAGRNLALLLSETSLSVPTPNSQLPTPNSQLLNPNS